MLNTMAFFWVEIHLIFNQENFTQITSLFGQYFGGFKPAAFRHITVKVFNGQKPFPI